MIDPYKITNYNRTESQLQEFLLFCILVAGKTAYIQAKKLEDKAKITFELLKWPPLQF